MVFDTDIGATLRKERPVEHLIQLAAFAEGAQHIRGLQHLEIGKCHGKPVFLGVKLQVCYLYAGEDINPTSQCLPIQPVVEQITADAKAPKV